MNESNVPVTAEETALMAALIALLVRYPDADQRIQTALEAACEIVHEDPPKTGGLRLLH